MDRLHFHVDQADSHVHTTVFMNGGNCGKLVFQTNEFERLLAALCESPDIDAYYTTWHGGPELRDHISDNVNES